MASLTIPLSDTHLQQLQTLAASQGLTPEPLLQSSIELWLDTQDPIFDTAIHYVLTKNAELYQRLA